jgi:3-methyladenine DNA glycosylase AlkD
MLSQLLDEIKSKSNPEKAKVYQRFFKTGKGEYGEGDIFLGLTVPEQREISKKYTSLSLSKIKKLIDSKVHEHRLTAILILVNKYQESFKEKNEELKKEIVNFYIKNSKKINNWDLVDLSAPNILGNYLLEKDKKVLYSLAKSKNLWEKRISIVSTLTFIKNNSFGDTLKISEILLKDKHDLIHKATGWMLREVGKKRKEILIDFIKTNYEKIPRTTLRYSIERFPKKEREDILRGKISNF